MVEVIDFAAETVDELFAAAQFQEFSDDEKLSHPAFESFAAGLRFGSNNFVFQLDPTPIVIQAAYETRIPEFEVGSTKAARTVQARNVTGVSGTSQSSTAELDRYVPSKEASDSVMTFSPAGEARKRQSFKEQLAQRLMQLHV